MPGSRGRGSGGLLTLIKNGLDFEPLGTCDQWCCIKVNLCDCSVFICSVYFNQKVTMSLALESLQALITDIYDSYNHPRIIIGGDFNCRIKTLGDCDENLTVDSILYPERRSLDFENPSTRSVELMDFMTGNGFLVLNGRVPGDVPAQFTFVGHQGRSVIDLVFINNECVPIVSDFVVDMSVTSSEHFPVVLTLGEQNQGQADSCRAPHGARLKWNPANIETYSRYLEEANLEACENLSVDDLYVKLCEAVWVAAGESGMALEPRKNNGKTLERIKGKKWFDGVCTAAKKEKDIALRTAKSNDFSEPHLSYFIERKREYQHIKFERKLSYELEIRNKFANVRNAGEFWAAVRSCRITSFSQGLPVEMWNEFYRHIYPRRVPYDFRILGERNPWLDGQITIVELEEAFSRCKSGKAPGMDHISNDFIKAMPGSCRDYILNLFNKILDSEKIPELWGKVIITMIHKKGDKNDPTNYRGIALVNCLTKLFTSILNRRLSRWAEMVGVLPNCQTGFREDRSCLDNIFVVNTTVQFQLRLGSRSVYCLYVDFCRAFDSVSHSLLWNKIHGLGVGGRFIRTVGSLYEQASLQVRSGGVLSDTFHITEGVLQGEMLSPLLFILFLHDVETYFRERNLYGPSINGFTDLLMMLYADDVILLASTPKMMRKMVSCLEQYCKENNLCVNLVKTKIVVCRSGGAPKGTRRIIDAKGNVSVVGGFVYQSTEIEIVPMYTYLGVTMSSSSLGLAAAIDAIDKAAAAAGSIKSILTRSFADSWDATLKLYYSMLTSTLLYAVPGWGLRYGDLIEAAQARFFKNLLLIPRNTPNYYVRIEFGVPKLILQIAKLTIRWIRRVLDMGEDRFPNMCLLRLFSLLATENPGGKYNWLEHFFGLFDGITIPFLSTLKVSPSADAWEQMEPVLYHSLSLHLAEQDVVSVQNSRFLQLPLVYSPSLSPAKYLVGRIPMAYKRIMAQTRLANVVTCTFYANRKFYNIDPQSFCPLCNLAEKETIEHLILRCPMYNSPRKRLLSPYFVNDWSAENLIVFLNCGSFDSAKALYFYISEIMIIREEILAIC